jgi:site-specific DNA-adenine methylase
MKDQFILNYVGNKYEELKKNLKKFIVDKQDFNQYDTFIEPFGGSFGFIRYVYEVLDIKDKKYVVYDSDKELIDLYNHLKKIDIQKFMDRYNEIINQIENTKGLTYISKSGRVQVVGTKIYDYIDENVSDKFMKYVLKNNICSGSFCQIRYKKNMIFADLIKKTTFIHKPFLKVNFSKYNKDKTFIFFDPPYLGEYNDFYKDTDVLSLLKKIHNLMTTFSGSFIHVKHKIIDDMFYKFSVDSYTKLYPLFKRKVTHNVFIS